MEEIYTIWEGEYSDKDVIGVTYDKEIADAFAKLHNGYVETAPIITDKTLITKANKMVVYHHYRYAKYNNYLEALYKGYVEPSEKPLKPIIKENMAHITVDIYGIEDVEKTKKIASDAIMKYLAEKVENSMLGEE